MGTSTSSFIHPQQRQFAIRHPAKKPFSASNDNLPSFVLNFESVFKDLPLTIVYKPQTETTAALFTGVYESSLKSSIVHSIKSLRPGVKIKSTETLAGKKELNLGKLPKGSLYGWHGTKETLPPATEKITYCCIHCKLDAVSDLANEDANDAISTPDVENVQLNCTRPKKRKTWVDATCECNFEIIVRNLAIPGDRGGSALEYVAVTVEEGKHLHTCSENLNIRAPLTPEDEDFLTMALFLHGGSPKEVWEKILAPMVNSADHQIVYHRLLIMGLDGIRRFARSRGLDGQIQQGEADFDKVVNTVKQWMLRGDNGACKLPGQRSQDALGLNPQAYKYLKDEDLFIFVQTRFQARLLERFGTCVASDATYGVVSYSNVKLICLHVTSYGEKEVQERGFNVAFILTTAERADVQSAIVAQVLGFVGNRWKPRILMTDMAFAAINAWRCFFPDIIHRWCVFHVWQAIRRIIQKQARPMNMPPSEFPPLRKKITRGFLSIISPEKELSWEEFHERTKILRKILWGKGLDEIASSLDRYLSNKDRWAPPARRDAVDSVYGSGASMPMLAVSNNSLERFFGILKYILLDGRTARHFSALLDMWWINQARIRSDAWAVGLNVRAMLEPDSLPTLCSPPPAQAYLSPAAGPDLTMFDESISAALTSLVLDRCDADDNEEDGVSSSTEEGEALGAKPVMSRPTICPSSPKPAPSTGSLGINISDSASPVPSAGVHHERNTVINPLNTLQKELLDEIVAARQVLDDLAQWAESQTACAPSIMNAFRLNTRHLSIFRSNILTACRLQARDTGLHLGAPSVRTFQPQRENFGQDVELLNEAILKSCDEELYRKKNLGNLDEDDEDDSLEAYQNLVDSLVNDPDFLQQAVNNEAKTNDNRFAALRYGLKSNTKMRLFAVARFIMRTSPLKTSKKDHLVREIIEALQLHMTRIRQDHRAEVEMDTVEIARVAQDLVTERDDGSTSTVSAGDVVLLRANAYDNYGEPSFTPTEFALAWILKENADVLPLVEISIKDIVWSRLAEKQKTINDLCVLG
jgi:hypothetical protein